MDLTLSKKTKVKQSKRSGEGVTAYVTEHTPTLVTYGCPYVNLVVLGLPVCRTYGV